MVTGTYVFNQINIVGNNALASVKGFDKACVILFRSHLSFAVLQLTQMSPYSSVISFGNNVVLSSIPTFPLLSGTLSQLLVYVSLIVCYVFSVSLLLTGPQLDNALRI